MTSLPVSYFTAPELDVGEYNEKVDVFTFSGILYQILTGQLPYQKMGEIEVTELLNKDLRPEFPTENISGDLKELIEMCWKQLPENRYSFDQIISKMIEKKIVFPQDEGARDKIYSFYEKNKITSDYTKECLNTFDIGKTFLYRFEFLRTRPILNSYQYKLRESSYSKGRLDDEKKKKLEKLYSKLLEKLSRKIPRFM